jgi:radical SAM protein with 4Fe4S-binding SPASM domain
VGGSTGERYQGWESGGHRREVVGHIRADQHPNGRQLQWWKYTPFTDTECRRGMALPGCLGGCAHHTMDTLPYEHRWDTVRYAYHERVLALVETAEKIGAAGRVASTHLAHQMDTRSRQGAVRHLTSGKGPAAGGNANMATTDAVGSCENARQSGRAYNVYRLARSNTFLW